MKVQFYKLIKNIKNLIVKLSIKILIIKRFFHKGDLSE